MCQIFSMVIHIFINIFHFLKWLYIYRKIDPIIESLYTLPTQPLLFISFPIHYNYVNSILYSDFLNVYLMSCSAPGSHVTFTCHVSWPPLGWDRFSLCFCHLDSFEEFWYFIERSSIGLCLIFFSKLF